MLATPTHIDFTPTSSSLSVSWSLSGRWSVSSLRRWRKKLSLYESCHANAAQRLMGDAVRLVTLDYQRQNHLDWKMGWGWEECHKNTAGWHEVIKFAPNFLDFSSWGVSFGSIHGGSGAKSGCGQLLPPHRLGLQDAAAAASVSAVAEADVGGFGWRTGPRRTIQNAWRAEQVTSSPTCGVFKDQSCLTFFSCMDENKTLILFSSLHGATCMFKLCWDGVQGPLAVLEPSIVLQDLPQKELHFIEMWRFIFPFFGRWLY